MLLAHIAPTSTLQTEVFENLDFHLCIASQVLKDPIYAEYYRNAKGFVILDVPTYEERDPNCTYSYEKLLQAIEVVQPNEVVLPDVWNGNTDINIDAALNGALVLPQSTKKRGPLTFIAVPRGNTYDEYKYCATEMAKIPGVTTLGIFTHHNMFQIDRGEVVADFRQRFLDKHLHMLGEENDLRDMQNQVIRKNARSMDTAKLVRFGLGCLHPIYHNVPDYPGRGQNYFEQEVSELQLSYIARNIRYWNGLVK